MSQHPRKAKPGNLPKKKAHQAIRPGRQPHNLPEKAEADIFPKEILPKHAEAGSLPEKPQPDSFPKINPPKHAEPDSLPKETPDAQAGGAGCLVRLGWMVLANVVTVICLVTIAKHMGSLFSAADAVFWAVAAAAIWLRHIDIASMNGRTAAGKPATLSQWRRYAGLLLAVCAVAWIVAHAVAWPGR